tara:strand:- start:1858 stop:2046 length:189 start_codon:yes stop_codon:yes gene_type:complete
MPPKQSYFKISGTLKYKENNSDDDFCILMKALDDNHAVMLVREHIKNHAPEGHSIITKIEKK